MAGVFFVTRLKENAAFEVIEECQVPANRNIRADQFIRLTGVQAQSRLPGPAAPRGGLGCRRTSGRSSCSRICLQFGATTIAAIYKERWKIELFFKALKQNLDREDLRRHQRKRPPHPDLDSLDRPAPAEMAASPLQGQLVPVQSGLDAAAEPVYLPRFDAVVRLIPLKRRHWSLPQNNLPWRWCDLDRLRHFKPETST